MIDGLLVLGIISVWGLCRFMQTRKEIPTASSAPILKDIQCPSCKAPLHIEGMLDRSVFFAPGAIVFDCNHCYDRVYFAPYEDNIEVGMLGCSPVVDPIPLESYTYPQNFDMKSNIQDGILSIGIKERSWKIPRYGLWNQRADIPSPNPVAKRDAPTARPLP
jgi:hypothetical protein